MFLLQRGGAEVETEFRIHKYGPYSQDVADAVEDLLISEKISVEIQPFSVHRTFCHVYELGSNSSTESHLPTNICETMKRIENFSTVELEVASTIALFEEQGLAREDAIGKTEHLKPARAIPPVLQKADEILKAIEQSTEE